MRLATPLAPQSVIGRVKGKQLTGVLSRKGAKDVKIGGRCTYSDLRGLRRVCCRIIADTTYIHTYIHAYIHMYIHAYMHTCIHAYIHTYIHACIHTYIHTYIHTDSAGCAVRVAAEDRGHRCALLHTALLWMATALGDFEEKHSGRGTGEGLMRGASS